MRKQNKTATKIPSKYLPLYFKKDELHILRDLLTQY